MEHFLHFNDDTQCLEYIDLDRDVTLIVSQDRRRIWICDEDGTFVRIKCNRVHEE